jgi:glycosyltransferase involved in cell wall biosynthesis
MRLLFVTPYLPGPPLFGGARRIYGLTTELAKSHEVSLLSLFDAGDDPEIGIANAQTYCKRVEIVSDGWHRIRGKPKRLLQLGSLLSPWSWEKLLYLRPAFQSALDRHLRRHEYDAVICEFMFMAGYRFSAGARQRHRPHLVLDEHNIEYDLLRRTAEASAVSRRVFHELNWRKLKREEIALWRRFDACGVTSTRDQTLVRRAAPKLRTHVVPNGVDVEDFVPSVSTAVEAKTLLFFGAINYYPNTDGALYFAERILPLLRALEPSIVLRIVGPGAEGAVTDLQSDGVQVLGFVDDVKAEIAKAAVVVVPLRIGGGTRLKILEAMAMGKTIVSTSLGAEGLDVEHDKDILLADTPQDFADQVMMALGSPELRERLGRAARQTAVERYSWSAAASQMEVMLLALEADRVSDAAMSSASSSP